MKPLVVTGYMGSLCLDECSWTYADLADFTLNLHAEIPCCIDDSFENSGSDAIVDYYGNYDDPDDPDDQGDAFFNFIWGIMDIMRKKGTLRIERCTFYADAEGYDFDATLNLDLDDLYKQFNEMR